MQTDIMKSGGKLDGQRYGVALFRILLPVMRDTIETQLLCDWNVNRCKPGFWNSCHSLFPPFRHYYFPLALSAGRVHTYTPAHKHICNLERQWIFSHFSILAHRWPSEQQKMRLFRVQCPKKRRLQRLCYGQFGKRRLCDQPMKGEKTFFSTIVGSSLTAESWKIDVEVVDIS